MSIKGKINELANEADEYFVTTHSKALRKKSGAANKAWAATGDNRQTSPLGG